MKRLFLLAALTLLPSLGWSWGTLIAPKFLSDADITKLETLCNDFGSPALKAEVRPRLGPHAMHQFIVQQAYKLLAKDPAFVDGASGLPTVQQINAWDGIFHGPQGPVQRKAGQDSGVTDILCPTPGGDVGGPSPDAELLTDLATVNPDYFGAAHYWNPWLQCGEAPNVAGKYFVALTHKILEGGTDNDKAHFAAYLAHYVGDVSSAKHADVVELTEDDVTKLEVIAKQWADEIGRDWETWIKSPRIKEAFDIMAARTRALNAGLSDGFWARAREHMHDGPLKQKRTFKVDVFEPTLESAIGAYLWELNHRPAAKGRMAFFGYFDPLYYNGPIFKALNAWYPSLQLTVALSTHLVWETNPAQFRDTAVPTVEQDKLLMDKPYDQYWSGVRPIDGYYAPDDKTSDPAREAYMQALVKSCSSIVHGKDYDDNKDFDQAAFMPYLQNSIRHVYLALRSSISALRVKAKFLPVQPDGHYQVKITITNLADEPVNLGAFRILSEVNGKLVSPTGWRFGALNESLAKNASKRLRVELFDVPKPASGDPVFIVEAHGKYDKTADSGARRARAVPDDNLQIVKNPDSTDAVKGTTGPLDLAIVFDVTGSMGASIGSMRDKAIEIVNALNKQSSDMRLALCAFRDAKADGGSAAFELHPFSKDVATYIPIMGTWSAQGGGDTPEDQLEAIRKILDLWVKEPGTDRKAAKILIVITDAPAHSPDSFGNTYASVAKLCHDVDPAHIYPVIVGSDPDALRDATTLASTTEGKVTTSADYASAADKLLEAVQTAVAEHPAASGLSPEQLTNLLLWGGAGAFGLGFLVLLGAVAIRRKNAQRSVTIPQP